MFCGLLPEDMYSSTLGKGQIVPLRLSLCSQWLPTLSPSWCGCWELWEDRKRPLRPTLPVCLTVQCWVCGMNKGLYSSSHLDRAGSQKLAQMWSFICSALLSASFGSESFYLTFLGVSPQVFIRSDFPSSSYFLSQGSLVVRLGEWPCLQREGEGRLACVARYTLPEH